MSKHFVLNLKLGKYVLRSKDGERLILENCGDTYNGMITYWRDSFNPGWYECNMHPNCVKADFVLIEKQ